MCVRSTMGVRPAVVAWAALVTHASAATWCPSYHQIIGHYDPSGPILVDGVWHVFPDGATPPGKGWSHFISTDLIRWTEQYNSTVAGGDTGSVSKTADGTVVLYPDTVNNVRGLQRQQPVGGTLGLNVSWTTPVTAVDKPSSLGVGFRDPSRALQMSDGFFYVGVGSGYGGENNSTGLPGSGTGCLAWFRASSSNLSAFEYVGCLMTNNHTTGHIDPATVAWQDDDRVAAFVECPDVFPLGDKHVLIASLYNWKAGGYYTNEYWVGSIVNNTRFVTDQRGLLDYGQYYAARTGSENQSPTERRVLFSATGWHNPPGTNCKTQVHLIPRDIRLDDQARLTFNPIPEIATLRTGVSRVLPPETFKRGARGGVATATGVMGTLVEINLTCVGIPANGPHGRVGVEILATTNGSSSTFVGYDYDTKRLVVDHTHSSSSDNSNSINSNNAYQMGKAASPPIVQTAPLAGGVESDGGAIEVYVLVDGALVESFLNRRAVISSWVSEVMSDTSPSAYNRTVLVAPVPEGVRCAFQGHELMSINTR